MRTLTKKQIESLYQFTQDHFVEWYDLQTELVDHLANDIEHIWQEHPNLSFYEARNRAFKKFGIFGFSDLMATKQSALIKKYWLLVWHFFKSYFKWPKVMLTLMLMAVVYTIFQAIPFKTEVSYAVLGLVLICPIVVMIKNTRDIKKRQKTTGKKWLFEHVASRFGEFFIFLQFPIHTFHYLDHATWSMTNQIIFAILTTLAFIFLYVILIVIPPQVKTEMINQHPEYKAAMA